MGSFPRDKASGEHEGDHSPPYNAEDKNPWSYIFTPPFAFMTCSGKTCLYYVMVT
jgi:hypothetical protein